MAFYFNPSLVAWFGVANPVVRLVRIVVVRFVVITVTAMAMRNFGASG